MDKASSAPMLVGATGAPMIVDAAGAPMFVNAAGAPMLAAPAGTTIDQLSMLANPVFAAALASLSALPVADLVSMTAQLSEIHPSDFAKMLSQYGIEAHDDGDGVGVIDDDDDDDDDGNEVAADIAAFAKMYASELPTQ